MKGIRELPQQQGSLDFDGPESSEQRIKRLVRSIREARETGRQFTQEESDYIDEQIEEDRVNDNPRFEKK